MITILSSILGPTFNGLYFAALLFFASVGLTLVFGVLNLLNMAHAAFFGLGVYIGVWTLNNMHDISTSLAVLLVLIVIAIPVVVSVLAGALDKTLFAPLYDIEPVYQLLATFGVLLMIEDLIKFIWGTTPIAVDSAVNPSRQLGSFEVLGSSLSMYRTFIVLMFIVTAVGLFLMFERTKLGKISLAMAEDYEMVQMLGINVNRVRVLIFSISVGLAALGGALFVPLAPATPAITLEYVLLSFAVIVIGGLGSLKGAIVASLIIGLVRSFGITYVPQIELAIVFLLMAAVIIVKPEGLFGHEEVGE
ncbi:ABC-type transport system permease protein (probable substrate branched-chain amino acids) [Natronomonas pharaonis DSM 2160]|uniref:ABC-type transport system permease protein (Probable substrate branched-chain amino acids) n=1 Tax=Natronomonas pharaonis (strain ATCC 35678 / DSM 2160 / CIP 103997 / JCM 8858 / NBRC 14720 / NCIMB 2260 / Gabara) TaxID=348780 RepID=A0A1U7EXB3_NATPD|nr:branched-chain amino acid ABC transporter permease [Natronomonas pharaonis]CAI49804.1 ABC-type transport system permease protein (probable substrate branched-chain amino acids) [Natronomonas pharaonis DSM 2160]